jgi:hypothetical protein
MFYSSIQFFLSYLFAVLGLVLDAPQKRKGLFGIFGVGIVPEQFLLDADKVCKESVVAVLEHI